MATLFTVEPYKIHIIIKLLYRKAQREPAAAYMGYGGGLCGKKMCVGGHKTIRSMRPRDLILRLLPC